MSSKFQVLHLYLVLYSDSKAWLGKYYYWSTVLGTLILEYDSGISIHGKSSLSSFQCPPASRCDGLRICVRSSVYSW